MAAKYTVHLLDDDCPIRAYQPNFSKIFPVIASIMLILHVCT